MQPLSLNQVMIHWIAPGGFLITVTGLYSPPRVNLKMNLRLMTASPVHLHSSIALAHTANPKWFICPHRLLCKCQSIIYLEAHDRI